MSIPTIGGVFFGGNVQAAAFNGVQSYVALLTQASTGAPTDTVVYSNFTGTIAWARTSAGIYTATLTGAFTSGKTVAYATPDSGNTNVILSISRTSANVVTLKAYATSADTPALADDLLAGASIQIMVFPS